MKGYTAREVEQMLGLPAAKLRAWARAGLVAPARGERGELRFSFQDLVLLRTAKSLLAAAVPPSRVRRALSRLRAQLPDGRPLSGVHISAEGNRIVVRDGSARWQPDSGQVLFDFGVAELEHAVGELARPRPAAPDRAEAAEAHDWYERACELEDQQPEAALAAYRRALALEPDHPEANINLGRLLHDRGDLHAAEACYRRGLAARPDDVTAAFNLGVALEDLGRIDDAVAAYRQAVAADPGCADAYYNLSRLCEKLGRAAEALRYLQAFRKLTR
jgi:tetratricopeptide (TPR) repeat protein